MKKAEAKSARKTSLGGEFLPLSGRFLKPLMKGNDQRSGADLEVFGSLGTGIIYISPSASLILQPWGTRAQVTVLGKLGKLSPVCLQNERCLKLYAMQFLNQSACQLQSVHLFP